jgi:CheY-like chemotaxis protein
VKTILLVEDNPVIVLAYCRHLEGIGFRVEVADDGLAAMKMLRSLKPDLVLLDIMMPRVDGTVVLKYIRSEPELKAIPVIVLSEVSNVELTRRRLRSTRSMFL